MTNDIAANFSIVADFTIAASAAIIANEAFLSNFSILSIIDANTAIVVVFMARVIVLVYLFATRSAYPGTAIHSFRHCFSHSLSSSLSPSSILPSASLVFPISKTYYGSFEDCFSTAKADSFITTITCSFHSSTSLYS